MENPTSRVFDLTGSHVAGALLTRIVYWCGKTTYKHKGYRWARMPVADWIKDARQTEKTFRTSFDAIKRADLVVVGHWKYKGTPRLWIRLSECGERLLNAPYGAPKGKIDSAPQGGEDVALQGGVDSALQGTIYKIPSVSEGRYKKKEDNKGSSSRKNPLAKNVSGFEKDSEENQQCLTNEKNACASAPENEEAMPKKFESCHDVVAGQKSKALLHNPNSAKALGRLWLTVFKEVHGPTAYNLTLKQEGMLKQVIHSCPPETAPQIVEKVIREWFLFTQHAKVNAAAYPIPGQPTIEFLLKYVACAVSFASSPNHQQEAPVFVSKKVEPLQSIALWKKPSLANPDTGSLEEALAIFNDDTDVN